MTLAQESPTADPSQIRGVRRWPVFLMGLVVGIMGAFAVSLLSVSGQTVVWGSASEMADAIGCSDSFVSHEVTHGTAGTCEVVGAEVMLRTFSSPEAQRAWVDGVASVHKGMIVSVEGEGYVAFSTTYDREIMTVIGPALSQ